MSEVKKKVYQDNDMYQARLEEVNNVVFVHITVKEMKKKTIDTLIDEFAILKEKIRNAGYNYLHTYSATPKFYKLFKDYEEVGDMDWEGKEYKVLRWELK
jgi:hypothetical protein